MNNFQQSSIVPEQASFYEQSKLNFLSSLKKKKKQKTNKQNTISKLHKKSHECRLKNTSESDKYRETV